MFARLSLGVLLCVCLAVGAACRKRPELLPDSPTLEAESTAAPSEAEKKKATARGPASVPPSVAAPKTLLQAQPLREAEPDKAANPVHGFPIPDGLRAVSTSSTASSYETRLSLASLERFYRREVGRDGTLNKRAYGFEVRTKDSNGFILVTQRPGSDTVLIGVVAHMVSRPNPPQEPNH